MIGFTVLGGYLGAGKTTVLNHFLKHNHGLRLALLINDFGAINIDAELIEHADDQQINLTNGCVCCNLTDGFFAALETLKEADPAPDHIVVEASGVADVVALGQYGHLPGFKLNSIVVVVDAERVQKLVNDKYVAQTVRRQLANADLLLLNKADLLEAQTLDALQEWLADYSQATVLPTYFGQVPTRILLDAFDRPDAEALPGQPSEADIPHIDYATWQLRCEAISFADVEALGRALQAEGVLRAKGLFTLSEGGVAQLQLVGTRLAITQDREAHSRHSAAPGELVVIDVAARLNREALHHISEALLGDTLISGAA